MLLSLLGIFLVLAILGFSLALLYLAVDVPYATTSEGDANDNVYPGG
jgi:hypothetical protein